MKKNIDVDQITKDVWDFLENIEMALIDANIVSSRYLDHYSIAPLAIKELTADRTDNEYNLLKRSFETEVSTVLSHVSRFKSLPRDGYGLDFARRDILQSIKTDFFVDMWKQRFEHYKSLI